MSDEQATKNGVGLYDTIQTHMNLLKLRLDFLLVFLDPKFQRKGGPHNGSGWPKKNCERFCQTLLNQTLTNKIELSDVEANISNQQYFLTEEREIEYYEDVLNEQGKKFISIDGYNTHSSIYFFVSTKEQIKEELGEDSVKYKLKVKCSDGKFRFFEELEKQKQEQILQHRLPVFLHRRISVQQMKNQFENLNQSTSLNAQEKRNCNDTNLTDEIRNYGEKEEVQNFFSLIFCWKEADFHQRKHEEVLAKMVNFINGTRNLKKAGLDELYENQHSLDTNSTLEFYFKNLKKFSKVIGDLASKKAWSQGQFFSFLSFLDALIEKDFELKDKKHKKNEEDKINIVIKEFEKVHTTMIEKSKSYYTVDTEKESYHFWNMHYTMPENYDKIKKIWKNILIQGFSYPGESEKQEPLIKVLLETKAVGVKRKKAALRTMFELAILQDWKDRNGKEITPMDIRERQKVHIAHLVPHVEGGPLIIENVELQFAIDNLRNGSKSLEPFFPFQKKHTQQMQIAA